MSCGWLSSSERGFSVAGGAVAAGSSCLVVVDSGHFVEPPLCTSGGLQYLKASYLRLSAGKAWLL